MNRDEVLRRPFDIAIHKVTFQHYLEVMIAPDGTIHYAVPSHQEFLIWKAMERSGITRDQVMDACPKEFYGNFIDWLIPQSGGYVPVWEKFVYDWPLNTKQVAALRMLKLNGLYHGKIPAPSTNV